MNPLALPFFCSVKMTTTPSDNYESHSTLQLLRIMKQRGIPFAAVILFPDHHKAAVKFLRLADKEEDELKRQAAEEAKYLARLAEIRTEREAEENIQKAELLQEIISRSQKATAEQKLKEAEEKARHAEFRAKLEAEAKEAIRKAVAEKAVRDSELRAIEEVKEAEERAREAAVGAKLEAEAKESIRKAVAEEAMRQAELRTDEQAKEAEDKARDAALQAQKEAAARSKVNAKVAIPLQPKIKQQPKPAKEQVDKAEVRAKEAQGATREVAVHTIKETQQVQPESVTSRHRNRNRGRGGRGRGDRARGRRGRGTKTPNTALPPLPEVQNTEEAAPGAKVLAKGEADQNTMHQPPLRTTKDSKGAAIEDPPLVSHLKTIQQQLGFDDCIHSMLPSKVVSSYVKLKARVMKPEHGELMKIVEDINRFLDDFVTHDFLRACDCVGGPPAWTVREFGKFDRERRAYLERG